MAWPTYGGLWIVVEKTSLESHVDSCMCEEIPPTNTLSQKDKNPSTLKHGQISLDVMHNPLKGYVKQSILHCCIMDTQITSNNNCKTFFSTESRLEMQPISIHGCHAFGGNLKFARSSPWSGWKGVVENQRTIVSFAPPLVHFQITF